MNRALKAFLRAIAALCLWGAPAFAVLLLVGALAMRGPTNAAMGLIAGGYVVVIGLLVGGVLQLLLSIDDRLERLEANR